MVAGCRLCSAGGVALVGAEWADTPAWSMAENRHHAGADRGLYWHCSRPVYGRYRCFVFVLAVGLKWLETRSARDFYVLFFILVYLSAVNFLFQQDILWAILTFAAIGCLLIGLQILNAPDLPDSMKSGWKRLGLLLVKTLPVVVLLFVFFPRMAPLWSVPLVSGEARSGISDTMRPGDISNLAQSSERAFRVTFGGAPPAYRDRYWRGLILDYLDGETWRQRDAESYQRPGRVALTEVSEPWPATNMTC